MVSSMAHPVPAPKRLLLFGHGAMSLDLGYFNRILSIHRDGTPGRWASYAVEDIESYWGSLCESVPKLQHTSGASDAQTLAEWLRNGAIPPSSTVANLPNSILGTLVIIAQLVEYLEYTKSPSQSGPVHGPDFRVPSSEETETIGCCLRVFSALVVSSSKSWAQFHHNAGAVLRTVFILGALSDAHDATDAAGASASLMVFWRGGQSASDLKRALERYPEAYVSVLYDDNRATVTTSSRSASAIRSHLQSAGISANETEFHGRFHAGQLYESDLQALFASCRNLPTFHITDAAGLVLPTRINRDTAVSSGTDLLLAASRAFLVEQFDWIKTLRSAVSSSLKDRSSRLVEFGPERCVPPTLLRRLKSQITTVDLENAANSLGGPSSPSAGQDVAENDIAVIGMACHVAGAQDLEQYWKIMLEGKSQHRELVPNDRFAMETSYRPSEKEGTRKWYGNFLDDHDSFDYKFFKKSPREALHMDPQQRLMLQVAYQAVAQSGYYHKPQPDSRVGCYIGVVGSDYENNISHTSPNAFSAMGALRCYIAGKVSHYFGWTGPSMTLDTACSASTIAMNLACQAITSGDCSAALVGGTNFCSAPLFFQNLAAGSFLSTTGQCRPFDKDADGYCRGDAIGAVYLKKLSKAIADGDQVLGVVSATAVNQNQNSTPIFVPNPLSLTDVFRTVISKSGLGVKDISVVEAHGTGTAVGDPAEYDSIRQVLGGPARSGLKPLQIGSVKGLIGHAEGASGVISLIKVLLMMQESRIPPQASFNVLNPSVEALPSDNMDITMAPIPWEDEFKAALVNNFGAAGSNAAMVVKQAPKGRREADPSLSSPASSFKCPIYITAIDDKGIRAYTTRLRQFIKAKGIYGHNLGIENLSFNLNRQSNWSLGRALVLAAESVDDLDQRLSAFETFETPAARPVILCFGGQVASFVGLDREVFDKSSVLRHYLDQCNTVCESICGRGIYPDIFQHEPFDDPSVLQPLLFSMQYASAMSWIDCGVEPAALVGHSFGELTALCVSGTLSLEDSVKLVYGRSRIIKDSWGPEKGSMMAVQADMEDVESVLAAANARLGENGNGHAASIACFNGPRSFTLAGLQAAIDAVQQVISGRDTVLKHKRLSVTNAFHSSLVEKLKTDLEAVGQKLTFGQPRIPLERATKDHENGHLSATYVAKHMREPVYFNHAVQRLAKQFPQAIWLEAGSNSTITTMAGRALGTPAGSVFQPVNITGTTFGLQQLANTSMGLWKAGLRVPFWPHSRRQTNQYAPVMLPPYQFEKHRHWLDFKPPVKLSVGDEFTSSSGTGRSDLRSPPAGVFTQLNYEDCGDRRWSFRINTQMKEFTDVLSGHSMGKRAPTCPVTYLIDMAIQAITSVRSDLSASKGLHPQIFNVVNQAPIFMDPSRPLHLDFESLDTNSKTWDFKFSNGLSGADRSLHVSGQLLFQQPDEPRACFEFNRLERLVTHKRYLQAMENSDDADDFIQGRFIYNVMSGIIDYGSKFRGVQKLVGRPSESAGKVVKRRSGETWLDFALGETFTQVGGIWANCMGRDRNTSGDAVYIIAAMEQWVKSPELLRRISRGDFVGHDSEREWHVLAQHKRTNPGDSFLTDIFVFDSNSGSLEEVILGVRYTPVSITQGHVRLETPMDPVDLLHRSSHATGNVLAEPEDDSQNQLALKPAAVSVRNTGTDVDLWIKLQRVLSDISGLDLEEIGATDSLADLGIDSLMGMEMAHDIEKAFHCTLDQAEIVAIVDVPGVMTYLKSILGLEQGQDLIGSDDVVGSDHPSSDSEIRSSTPASSVDHIEFPITYDDSAGALGIPPASIVEVFCEAATSTDHLLKSHGCAHYLDGVSLIQTRLCLKLIDRAFKKLGCDLETAQPGDYLQPVSFDPKHRRFHQHLYKILEDTRIININGDVITRTGIPLPAQSAESILEDLMQYHGQHGSLHQLTYNLGSKMAEVLSGEASGPQLLFGDARNRELAADFYGEYPFNKVYFELMANFLTNLAERLKASSHNQTTLRILEMGAGTGGATKMLVPTLVKLGIPFEYTFTDLSPSLVAQARKKFKSYPSMKFLVHDIEKPPSDPRLYGSQHIVIASNAVHATHSLNESLQNSRKFLRPDGFLMLIEMMETLHCIDLVWGTLEDWWLFDDDRTHAIVDQTRWERELLSAGYKHVDWTDGKLPESRSERILIALAGDGAEHLQRPAAAPKSHGGEHGLYLSEEAAKARVVASDEYLRTTTSNFLIPESSGTPAVLSASRCVLVTGATGSLGCHIVEYLAGLSSVDRIWCLNRPSVRKGGSRDPLERQIQSMESKGIRLDATMMAKLQAIETDTSKPQLGLEADQYNRLVDEITHIVHNAYPSNGLRTLTQNENQFAILRNLIDFSAKVVSRRRSYADGSSPDQFKFTFQFVSSMAAVGVYPAVYGNGQTAVPEEFWDVDSALANGYGGSKSVCERILRDTLGKYPDHFRTMTVRLGQLSGSRVSGYWNHMEVLGFLFKSSQTLASFPILDGVFTWLSLEDTAGSLSDLLLRNESDCYPIYHLDNPVHKKWNDITPLLAEALGIPENGIVPLDEWIRRVRGYPGEDPWDNPAAKALDFFEHKFLHMSCGGVTLATDKTREHSKTLRELQPISDEVLKRYIQAWKASGFLR
ncbi:beta-ketoacyl synthase domain-containing protein [Colletotrichum graminicola]|uniref:Beta-ketoacyl synthase domain-containing protein n=1 Tax=Colletotrichum graminicola (strain M1.001 / M2 / FGSC 10212) TaxID=645133 RepID=E3QTD6_COLGM|nr:beta-ketoacyl synthase domain-containing protein [Colletotrichum graminicola M1.001]EFQ34124.1 beta-ketoacyl synthase domain-containing protein [Colletotrichum graminicola M1.001]WDK20900.1 beta-ketoacyl synthase domain-containing protein [Colletotrichum graminicola]